MTLQFSWLAAGAVAAGLVAAYFVAYLWPYRDAPGAKYFVATIVCEGLWSTTYGLSLLVHDLELRYLFEIPIWASINFIGVFFLAFALAYTGRRSLLNSRWMAGLVGLQAVQTLVVATNPWHHVAWSDYTIDPVAGAATVSYTHQPWLFVNATVVILLIVAASLVLVDTFFSYGPLYRSQAAAVAISPAIPGAAFVVWLLGVGTSPPLNLTPFLFPLHLAFDFYAFFWRDMFELAPAARRVGQRAVLDDLGSAVLIVDEERRVVDLNDAAREVLGTVDESAVLGDPLADVLPGVDPVGDDQTVSLSPGGVTRQYAVTTAGLADAGGAEIGRTVLLQDVTRERRREQRLSVLNRVLRHNLRNDLGVVRGFLGVGVERVEDDDLRGQLETAAAKTDDVLALAEKARDVERAMAAGEDVAPVALAPVVRSVAADLREAYPEATVTVAAPGDATVLGAERLLDAVVRNLVENALEHGPPDGTVAVTVAAADDDTVVLTVADEGPGIAAHELDVLDAESESALEHGSGLGLWVVNWGVASLGGRVEFDTDGDGTTVTVELPVASGD